MKWIKSNYIIFLFLVGFTVLALYPYWIFGQYSALGWYDEFSGTIPWYLAIQNIGKSYSYLHGYIGGVSAAEGYLEGTEKVSLIKYLLYNFDLWFSNFLLRLLGVLFSIFGIFLCVRKLFGCSKYLSLSLGVFAIFVNFIPYGWMLASVGWCPGIAAWLVYIQFASFKQENLRYLLLLLVSIIAAITTPPVFLIPFVCFTIFTFWFVFSKTTTVDYIKLKNLTIFWLIFLIPQILNWFEGIDSSVLRTSSFSARILQTLSASSVPADAGLINSTIHIIKQDFYELAFFILRDPHKLLPIIYVFVGLFAIFKGKKREASIVAFIAIVLPVLFHLFFNILNVPFASQYSWHTLWEMHSVIFTIYFGYLASLPWINYSIFTFSDNHIIGKTICYVKNNSLKIVSSILIFISIIAVYKLTSVSMQELHARGGVGITNIYEPLKKLKHTSGKYRVISKGNFSASIPTYYGLDTFDGLLHISAARRNLFIAYAMHSPPKHQLNTGWHVFYDFPNNINVSMLQLANVKYVFSDQKIDGKYYNLIDYFPATFAREIPYIGKKLLERFLNDIRLIPPLYAYEIIDESWPRVGVVKKLHISEKSYKGKEFYNELLSTSKDTALIAKDDAIDSISGWKENSELDIISYNLTKQGVTINISNGGGVIYINNVYTPHWKAMCNGEQLTLIPANGVMMVTKVPSNCTRVELKYL